MKRWKMDKGKFIPFVVAEKKPARVEQYRGGIPEGTIRLPNGDWVTPKEYEQLLQQRR